MAALTSQVESLKAQLAGKRRCDVIGHVTEAPPTTSLSPSALEGKTRSVEKKAEALAKEKIRLEVELESMTRKSHDASGQLVHISQELLKKERYLLTPPRPPTSRLVEPQVLLPPGA